MVLVLEMGMVAVRMVLDRGDDDNKKKKLWVHGLFYCRSARLGVQCRILMSCGDTRKCSMTFTLLQKCTAYCGIQHVVEKKFSFSSTQIGVIVHATRVAGWDFALQKKEIRDFEVKF